MKNLKKFNENWIDDETEDTNRRMSELDNKEVNNTDDIDNLDEVFDSLGKDIIALIDSYRNRVELLNSYTDNEVLEYIMPGIK